MMKKNNDEIRNQNNDNIFMNFEKTEENNNNQNEGNKEINKNI